MLRSRWPSHRRLSRTWMIWLDTMRDGTGEASDTASSPRRAKKRKKRKAVRALERCHYLSSHMWMIAHSPCTITTTTITHSHAHTRPNCSDAETRVGAGEHCTWTEGERQREQNQPHRACAPADPSPDKTCFDRTRLPCQYPYPSLQEAQAGSSAQLHSILFTLELLIEAAVVSGESV